MEIRTWKTFLIDLIEKRVIGNDEIKTKLARKFDYKKSLNKSQIYLKELNNITNKGQLDTNEVKRLQSGFGYTKEDINFFIEPILKLGIEPIGSMGTDTQYLYFLINQSFFFHISNNVCTKLLIPLLIPLEKN